MLRGLRLRGLPPDYWCSRVVYLDAAWIIGVD